jgi:hypothetical protein
MISRISAGAESGATKITDHNGSRERKCACSRGDADLVQLFASAEGEFVFSPKRNRFRKLSFSSRQNWHVDVRNTLWQVSFMVEVILSQHELGERHVFGCLSRIPGYSNLPSAMKYILPWQDARDGRTEPQSGTAAG